MKNLLISLILLASAGNIFAQAVGGGGVGSGGGGGGAVSSVFGRTGAVAATSGDYTASQVTGAATSGANSNITSLTGLTTPLTAAQGGTGNALGGGMALIQKQTLGSSSATVTFSSIPQTYTNLELIIQSQTNSASAENAVIEITFNGDSGNNYTHNLIFNGAGSTVSAAGATGAAFGYLGDAGLTTSVASTSSIIANYAGSLAKSCVGTSTGSDFGVLAVSGGWSSTAAITSIALAVTGGSTFSTGSTFSLYGLQ